MADRRGRLETFQVPVQLRLSALWAALMFCFVYGDFFGLFRPGKLDAMGQGQMGPLGEATPTVLLGVSIMMAIPGVMVFLSLVSPPWLGRWLNILLGVAYAAIMLLTMRGAPLFYVFFGVVEVLLLLTIIWSAWRWPRSSTS